MLRNSHRTKTRQPLYPLHAINFTTNYPLAATEDVIPILHSSLQSKTAPTRKLVIMSSGNNAFEHVAGNWAFVGFAYLMTFGVWTAITQHDFISSKWLSVEKTRHRGLLHLGLILIPMVYMVVYIVLQGLAGDFKEMWTGFIAFAFVVVHFLRTVC